MTSTAMGQRVDIEKLRVALRRMSRDNLLSVANRAIDLVPRARLGALVAGMVRLDLLTEGKGRWSTKSGHFTMPACVGTTMRAST
jgi:hypothetical protein